jgi:hypothetical protein
MKTNRQTRIFTLLIVTCSLLLVTCGDTGTDSGTGNYLRFDWNIQGTWTTNDTGSLYSGKLIIDYNRITITGYSETQTPTPGGDDTQRPFRNITKGIPLKGYTEEGQIYIEDAGLLQTGIPYTYWYTYSPSESKNVYFLRFTFGGRQETLRKEN